MPEPTSLFQIKLEYKRLQLLNEYAGKLVNFKEELRAALGCQDISLNDKTFIESLITETEARTRVIHDEFGLLSKKTDRNVTKCKMHLVSQ